MTEPCSILAGREDIERRVKEGFRYLVIAGPPGDTDSALAPGQKVAGQWQGAIAAVAKDSRRRVVGGDRVRGIGADRSSFGAKTAPYQSPS